MTEAFQETVPEDRITGVFRKRSPGRSAAPRGAQRIDLDRRRPDIAIPLNREDECQVESSHELT